MALILLPTVELEPSSWAGPGYEGLIGSAHWDELWNRSLSLWQLEPVAPGAWHVSVELLGSEKTLTKLLTLELLGSGVEGFPDRDGKVGKDEEQIMAMSGGYALLEANGDAIASPSCCCTLGDLCAWRHAATIAEGEELWLEIGHGTWSARRDERGLSLTEEPELRGADPVTISVAAGDLLAATYVAELALEAFRRRLLPILRRLVDDGERAESLSHLMVGLPVE